MKIGVIKITGFSDVIHVEPILGDTQIFQNIKYLPSCVQLVSTPHLHLTWGVWGAFYKTPHFWGVGKVTHYCGDCGKMPHFCAIYVENK